MLYPLMICHGRTRSYNQPVPQQQTTEQFRTTYQRDDLWLGENNPDRATWCPKEVTV